MKVSIIIGATRRGAVGPAIGEWVKESVRAAGHEAELIRLADFDVPFFDMEQLPAQVNKQYPHDSVMRWSRAIDEAEALLIVSPEYNHGIPGALKNAIDWLWDEWSDKPTGIVTYSGGPIGGARAAIQLRAVLGHVGVRLSRYDVAIGRAHGAVPTDAEEGIRKVLTDQLEQLAVFSAQTTKKSSEI